MRKEVVLIGLEKMILLEEISLRQKLRVLCSRRGTKIQSFFHRIANSNQNRNTIGQLSIDGVVSTNKEAI